MWEYILAAIKSPNALNPYYTFQELLEEYNKNNGTKFIGGQNGHITDETYHNCYIKTLDGMCGVMVAHKMQIESRDYPKWLPLLNYMAHKGNYTKIQVTNVVGPRTAAWRDLGFTCILAFRNKRTQNNVEILVKDVT